MTNLEKLAAVGTKKSATVKQDRPVMEVPEAVLENFKRLVGADCVLKVVEARKKNESEVVYEELLDVFAETLFKYGNPPANPRLQTLDKSGAKDMSGIFQVQNRFKFTMPDNVDGDKTVKVRLQFALESAGLSPEVAQQLVANEIDCSPVVGFRSYGELTNGHYEGEGKNRTFVEATEKEKAIGEKMFAFVMGTDKDDKPIKELLPLTEEERAVMIVTYDNIDAKKGFLQRLKSYCSSVEEMKSVFKVITPVHFISDMKLGEGNTPEQRDERLKNIASAIIGKVKAK